MTAQQLLERLLTLQQAGQDLNQLEVITRHTEYDPHIQYDIGIGVDNYPDGAEVQHNQLVIR